MNFHEFHEFPILPNDELLCTIAETISIFAPENGWLEYDPFLLGRLGLCSDAMLVSRNLKLGRKSAFLVYIFWPLCKHAKAS